MLATLLRDWKLIVIGVLALALTGVTRLYFGERDALSAQTAAVEQAARDAQAEKVRIEQQHAANLAQVRKDHEAQIPIVRANAVANYRAAHRVSKPAADNVSVPGDSPGIRVDDAAERQCVPDDTFISDAAEDAEKLAAWQDWCKRNGCPVEE